MVVTSSSTARKARFALTVLASVLLLTSASCKKADSTKTDGADDAEGLAEDGTDAASAETDTEIVTSSLVSTASDGSLAPASTGELVANELATAGVGDGAKRIFMPRN